MLTSSRLWLGAVIALAAVAPFERLAPLVSTPWQKLSNTEVVALAAIGAAVAAVVLSRRFIWRTPMTWPVIFWLVALVITSVAAPAYTANALRAAGRCAAGFGVLLIGVNAFTSLKAVRTFAIVALVAGVIVAVIGLAEQAEWKPVLNWLRSYRPGVAVVGGDVRLTSTLQYPTIASMYLEIVFGLGLGLFLTAIDAGARVWSWLTAAALVVIAQAIVLTLTRAGIIAIVSALALVLFLRWRRHGADRGVGGIALVSAAVVCLLVWQAVGGVLLRRLGTVDDRTWYRARLHAPPTIDLRPGERRRVLVTVENTGSVTWDSDASPPFHMSHHWLTDNGLAAATPDQPARVVAFDGLRTAFDGPVRPGESALVQAWIEAPSRPGRYRVAWDIVLEHRLWFGLRESEYGFSTASVSGPPTSAPAPSLMLMPERVVRLRRLELWRLGIQMLGARPLAGVGMDNFRLLYGPLAGLTRFDNRVHTNNMYLEVFVSSGLAGGSLFLWIFWRLGRTLLGAWRRVPLDTLGASPIFSLQLGAAAGVVVVGVHGLVDSFLTFTPTYLMIWLTLAVALAMARISSRDPREADAHRI